MEGSFIINVLGHFLVSPGVRCPQCPLVNWTGSCTAPHGLVAGAGGCKNAWEGWQEYKLKTNHFF